MSAARGRKNHDVVNVVDANPKKTKCHNQFLSFEFEIAEFCNIEDSLKVHPCICQCHCAAQKRAKGLARVKFARMHIVACNSQNLLPGFTG